MNALIATPLQANQRPLTPPSYVPSGWTIEQAKGLNLDLVAKLVEERLWAAGQTEDDVQRTLKQGRLPNSALLYIPTGWTDEQALLPSFELLSQLSHQDLGKFMEARNKAVQQLWSSSHTPQTVEVTPSPLVETLQRAGFPPWGFVIVRTYYGFESRWEKFQERLDEVCDQQLTEETGEGIEKIQETLEFKIIEDPRLEGVGAEEARKHFRIAKSMGGIGAGLDMSVLLLVDEEAVDSVLEEGVGSSHEPYVTAVDVTESGQVGGYQGHFKVSLDAFICEIYPKVSMGLSPRALWSMMDEADGI